MKGYVGSINDRMLEESLCPGCSGSCGTCFVKNGRGEDNMSVLDKRIDEAFGPYERPESKESSGFAAVYQITKDGRLVQTPGSKRDEKVYWEEQEEEETIQESGLSLDEQFKEAFK